MKEFTNKNGFYACIILFAVIASAPCVSNAYDPGLPDSLIVGNLDGSHIQASPGDTVSIPVWLKNDEDVESIFITIGTEDEYISERLTSGNIYSTLTTWPEIDFWASSPNQPVQDYTSQVLAGYYIWLTGPFGDLLNTGGSWLHIADYDVVIIPDPAKIGNSTQLVAGLHPIHPLPNCETILINEYGYNEWTPVIIGGYIDIVAPGFEYLPGDANMGYASWPTSVTGGDLTYLINYLRSLVPACTFDGFYAAADVNGSCSVDGGDVTVLNNYLRLIIPELFYCPDYPPASLVEENFPACELSSRLDVIVIPTTKEKQSAE